MPFAILTYRPVLQQAEASLLKKEKKNVVKSELEASSKHPFL